MSLTPLQKAAFVNVVRAQAKGQWYRATNSGERVSLASLYRRSLAKRRAWRGQEGASDAAYEYQLEASVVEVLQASPDLKWIADLLPPAPPVGRS